MKEDIYLIYNDSMENCATIKGVIIGTEEDAERWCYLYNVECQYPWDEVWWERLKILTDDDIDDR